MPNLSRLIVAICGICVLGALARPVLAAETPSPAGLELFEKKIRPTLVNECYKCHSATSEKLKGNLLLDTRDGILAGGDTGPAVVPGDPANSQVSVCFFARLIAIKMNPLRINHD